MVLLPDQKRKEAEREFHNARFGAEHDNREPLSKWYAALAACGRQQNELVRRYGRGARVLEYGCANGRISLAYDSLAHETASFHGIDISDAAIRIANENVVSQGLVNCLFTVMDAEHLTFSDNEFDLVFGRGILHHLDLNKCFPEIARVLRPGGKAIFSEPLGHNPALNFFRWTTPHLRTVDEHPLLMRDLTLAQESFREIECTFFGLTTVLAVPFQKMSFGAVLMSFCEQADSLLLQLPLVKRYAWSVLLVASK
jgi:SAM-dependent methyltransferase